MSEGNMKIEQKEINLFNIIYDDDFVSLINGLSSTIKDYYKLTKLNINETTSYHNLLQNEDIILKNTINEMKKSNSLNKANDLFSSIEKINETKKNLENTNKENEKNLINFLENAKTYFKKMKQTRNEKLTKINTGMKNYKSTRNLTPKNLTIKSNEHSRNIKSVSPSTRNYRTIEKNDQIVKLANNVIFFITKLNEKKNNDDEQIDYMKKELNLLAKNAIIRHSSSSPKLKTNRNIFEEKLLNNDKEYLNIKLREELEKK
jgi:hypothetical protein